MLTTEPTTDQTTDQTAETTTETTTETCAGAHQTAETILGADAASPLPLRLLARAIDREFERRTPDDGDGLHALARLLHASVHDLTVTEEGLDITTGLALGRWLLLAARRHAAPAYGHDPASAPRTCSVAAADGDVSAFQHATVLLPAGVLGDRPTVARLTTQHWGITAELVTDGADPTAQGERLRALLAEVRAGASPFRRGRYRVSLSHHGLALSRWAHTPAGRASLLVDDEVWTQVDRGVHRVLALSDRLRERGLATSAGVLLVGPPGTGKTQLGSIVAGELDGRATVLVPDTRVTEGALTALFDLASALAPTLVLIDDLDLVAGERGHTDPHRLREFLNVMDGGLVDRSGVVVVASTNDHRKIDKAARRSSRFDTVITLDLPREQGRLAILRRYLAWSADRLDLATVARATEGASGADLKELVRAAVLDTDDQVTTDDLLRLAARAAWRPDSAPAGVYL